MDLRVGYFPVLDAALALRQLHEPVRFSPFNPIMQGIQERFDAPGLEQAESVAVATDGWLTVLGTLIEEGAAGCRGAEEGLMQLIHEPEAALPFGRAGDFEGLGRKAVPPGPEDAAEAGRILARVLRSSVLPESARRSRMLLETSEAIRIGLKEQGVWPYLLGISDRLRRADSGEIVFRIKPEFRIQEQAIHRIMVTPSLVATRRLTFWRNNGAMVFFVAVSAPTAPDDPPDGLLLAALAVGDRTRLKMLRRLSEGACTNVEMAGFLGMNPSTASRHFKIFKDAGFVEIREGEGGRAEYVLHPEGMATAFRDILAFATGKETPCC